KQYFFNHSLLEVSFRQLEKRYFEVLTTLQENLKRFRAEQKRHALRWVPMIMTVDSGFGLIAETPVILVTPRSFIIGQYTHEEYIYNVTVSMGLIGRRNWN